MFILQQHIDYWNLFKYYKDEIQIRMNFLKYIYNNTYVCFSNGLTALSGRSIEVYVLNK